MAGTLGVEPAEPRASSAMGPPPLETLPESPAADGLPAGMGRLRSVRPLSD